MFPVLFAIGPLEIRTMSLFVFIGFFLSSFIFWRKGKEEHYSQGEIFDGFLVSTIVGALFARAVFVIFNINVVGWNVINWFDLANYPGVNLIAGLGAAAFYLYKYSVKNKWDAFEVLDFWVTSTALGLAIYSLGSFFEGVGYGYATNLPWGMVFPQLIEPHHPIQLYFALFYLGLYFYLSRVEYRYRTFTWYRHGKKTAQTGFLTAVFLIIVSVFTFFIGFLKPATLEFLSINFDMVLSLVLAVIGILLLFVRSGRMLPTPVKKKAAPVRTKIENLHE